MLCQKMITSFPSLSSAKYCSIYFIYLLYDIYHCCLIQFKFPLKAKCMSSSESSQFLFCCLCFISPDDFPAAETGNTLLSLPGRMGAKKICFSLFVPRLCLRTSLSLVFTTVILYLDECLIVHWGTL